MHKNKFKSIILIIIGTILIISGITLGNKVIENNKKTAYIENNIINIQTHGELVEFNLNTNNADLPISKAEGQLPVTISVGTKKQKVDVYGTIQVQGTSTEWWPKKNWKIKFYKDEEQKEKLLLKIDNSVPSDDWIAKADWIDPMMLRNGISYKLFEQIQNTGRKNSFIETQYLKDENFHYEEATGVPAYFTSVININEEHYGIASLLLAHDPKNYNINKNNPKHLFFEFDTRKAHEDFKNLRGWEKFRSDHLDITLDSYTPDNGSYSKEQKMSIDSLGKFINSDIKNFEKNFDKFLSKENIIDYMLYMELIYDWDAVTKDLQMLSYDLQKYFILPWDKDSTFGIDEYMKTLDKDSSKKLSFNYEEEEDSNALWYKTYKVYTKDVELRYKVLRDKDVFSVNNIKKLTDSILNKLSNEIIEKEKNRWQEWNRNSYEELGADTLIKWTEERLEMLDRHFNYN